jgi:hypothetical protein
MRRTAQGAELAIVPGSAANLQAFIDRCRQQGCLVLSEAAGRLSNAIDAEAALAAQAAAQTRAALVAFNTHVNYDMHGGDILDQNGKVQFIRTDAVTCVSTCRETAACVGVSYDKWNRACYLKTSLSELTLDPHSDASIRADRAQPGAAVTAKRFCPYPSSQLLGDEIQRVQLQSQSDCERRCLRDESCVAYTLDKSARLCTSFRAVSDRQSRVSQAISAVRTQYPCR